MALGWPGGHHRKKKYRGGRPPGGTSERALAIKGLCRAVIAKAPPVAVIRKWTWSERDSVERWCRRMLRAGLTRRPLPDPPAVLVRPWA